MRRCVEAAQHLRTLLDGAKQVIRYVQSPQKGARELEKQKTKEGTMRREVFAFLLLHRTLRRACEMAGCHPDDERIPKMMDGLTYPLVAFVGAATVIACGLVEFPSCF